MKSDIEEVWEGGYINGAGHEDGWRESCEVAGDGESKFTVQNVSVLIISPPTSKKKPQGNPQSLEGEKGVFYQLLKYYRTEGDFCTVFYFFVHTGYLSLPL